MSIPDLKILAAGGAALVSRAIILTVLPSMATIMPLTSVGLNVGGSSPPDVGGVIGTKFLVSKLLITKFLTQKYPITNFLGYKTSV